MPNLRSYDHRVISNTIKRLKNSAYVVVGRLSITAWTSKEPLSYKDRTCGNKRKLDIGQSWGEEVFDCAWFNFVGKIPSAAKGQKVVALIDVNGELVIVDRTGSPVRGLTNKSSFFDYRLGEPVKRVFELTPKAKGNEKIDLWADASFNDLFGGVRENGVVKQADIAICNTVARSLYYDMQVLEELRQQLPEDSARHQKILAALHKACDILVNDGDKDIRKARKILSPLLKTKNGDPSLNISAVGHAHLDLAWLWPIRESIRKGARTFATALDLIEKYPKYVFGASQPQLFLWMKENYPSLYRRIKAAVKAGRIEPQGAAWVESDTNIPAGESLIRQMLLGKRFFRKEFDQDIRNLWLPDVFGYSAALPRILVGCDIDVFMTQKLSWSQVNTYPHHSFVWQGIGEGEVLSHLLPEDNYNSPATPCSAAFIEKNYKDKDVSSHALMCFGIGDGGGGPGMEHLENLDRMENLAGICPVTQEPAHKFFEKWRKESDKFEKWVGELYVEMHQGTLTTHGKAKRYNRLCEIALRELEMLSVFADGKYPHKQLERIWQEVLLYQFHDILPGSSIKRVYDEAYERYELILSELDAAIDTAIRRLAKSARAPEMKKPVVVFNSLAWPRSEWIKLEGTWRKVDVPSMGYVTVDASIKQDIPLVKASETVLENDLLKVRFDKTSGQIISVHDKRLMRELLVQSEKANRLQVYRDTGDAWDFPMNYASQPREFMKLTSSSAEVDGPKAILTQTYEYPGSTLTQKIILTAGSSRIDFQTSANWNSPETMLRVAFPVDVQSNAATYEIQFGTCNRTTHNNTSWDLAKNECAAQRFADLSQPDFGVALLNDCKYGHKIKGSTMELNLIRCVPYPKAFLHKDDTRGSISEDHRPVEYTDTCSHKFTYSLLPHKGDHIEGKVAQAGYELNIPLRTVAITGQGKAPSSREFFSVDNENVIIETIKRAEDSDATIVRLYESAGTCAKVNLSFDGQYRSVDLVNLIEEQPRPIEMTSKGIRLDFRPFEIKTLSLKS